MAQHVAAQKKGETRSRSRQVSTRAKAKAIRYMERCGLRPSTEGKIIGGSEIRQSPLARKEKRKGQETKASFAKPQRQTCRREVALEELCRHLILLCWFQHHYQRLFLAYQGQQKLLLLLYQQYMSASISSSGTLTPSTSSEPVATPSVPPPQMVLVMHQCQLHPCSMYPPHVCVWCVGRDRRDHRTLEFVPLTRAASIGRPITDLTRGLRCIYFCTQALPSGSMSPFMGRIREAISRTRVCEGAYPCRSCSRIYSVRNSS
jgi:hypothetical protein